MVRRDIMASADYIMAKRLAPLVAEAVRRRLPIAVGCDESPDVSHGKRPVVQYAADVASCSSGLDRPEPRCRQLNGAEAACGNR